MNESTGSRHPPQRGGRAATGETLRKASSYLFSGARYWRASLRSQHEPASVQPYPIDLVQRLREGHFRYRDSSGIPIKSTRAGVVHTYTRVCGYGLASLAEYGRTRDDSHLEAAIKASRYVRETGDRSGSGLRLRSEIPGAGHTGTISAMSHGMAISLSCRLLGVTGDRSYLDDALALREVFFTSVEDGGVASEIRQVGATWYEEDTRQPLTHILNGMIFALWGLFDLKGLDATDGRTRSLAAAGLEGVRRAAGGFDSGWWSWYNWPEAGRRYLASLPYHHLHASQLSVLGRQAADEDLLRLADRFERYAASPILRLRAGAALAAAKIRRDYPHSLIEKDRVN